MDLGLAVNSSSVTARNVGNVHVSAMAVLRFIRGLLLAPFAVIIGLPGLLFILLFMAIVFIAYLPKGLWWEYKWKSRLRRRGRYRNETLDITTVDHGTLIVDAPSLGWGVQSCWWTVDRILDICPYTVPTLEDRKQHIQKKPDRLELPFDVWCYDNYINADNGSAILLTPRRGDRYAKRLTARSSSIDRVDSWSAPVVMIESNG